MSFKYSAVTENTPEMREWLEGLGYKLSEYYSDNKEIIFTKSSGVYGTIRNTPDEIHRYSSCEHVLGGRHNCLGNPELFKAVTAIRDDSDYMQWFTDGRKFWLFASKFLREKGGRKATLEELQEHFKIKPK